MPCTAFRAGTEESRRDAQLRFVAQNGHRFVIKAYQPPGARSAEPAVAAIAREQAARHAFGQLGIAVLQPVLGPVEQLEISVNGTRERFSHAMVFPYRVSGTLDTRLAPFGAAALDTLKEAGTRIAARHRAATSLAAIHSDGAPHNIFADWVWFDFATEHRSSELASARAHEVWRFLCGTLAVHPGLAHDDRLVAAFCEGYGDREILELLLTERHDKPLWLQMLLHPIHGVRLLCGDGRRLTRPRTWRALHRWLNATR